MRATRRSLLLQAALPFFAPRSAWSAEAEWKIAVRQVITSKDPITQGHIIPPPDDPSWTEAHAILDELEHRRDADYADALYVAVLRDALGERAEAFKEIERAFDENSAFLYSINVDPKMDTFRDDRRFARLQDSIRIKGCKQ